MMCLHLLARPIVTQIDAKPCQNGGGGGGVKRASWPLLDVRAEAKKEDRAAKGKAT